MTRMPPMPLRQSAAVIAAARETTSSDRSVLDGPGLTGAVARSSMMLAVFFLVAVSNTALAADVTKSGALQRVGAACQGDAIRFCSWADPGTADPGTAAPGVAGPAMDGRDVFICLRLYTSNLSQVCRKAINDAKQ